MKIIPENRMRSISYFFTVPKHIGTPTGLIIQVAYTLAPGLVDAIAYQGYRVFPDSSAAGGTGRTKFGKGDRRLSAAAAALVRLTRGFHW
jgi:hypothetical protein